MNEEQKEKELSSKKKLSPKQIFWIRFSFWTIFAAVLPVIFIVWRFDLFSQTSATFGGWGFVAVIIIAVFIISLLKYIRQGMEYSMVSQCIGGFCKITLPLLTLLLAVYFIKNNLDSFLQAMGCVIVCETIAIPINPMPKWINDHKKETNEKNFDSMTDILWDKFFSRKDKDKE